MANFYKTTSNSSQQCEFFRFRWTFCSAQKETKLLPPNTLMSAKYTRTFISSFISSMYGCVLSAEFYTLNWTELSAFVAGNPAGRANRTSPTI